MANKHNKNMFSFEKKNLNVFENAAAGKWQEWRKCLSRSLSLWTNQVSSPAVKLSSHSLRLFISQSHGQSSWLFHHWSFSRWIHTNWDSWDWFQSRRCITWFYLLKHLVSTSVPDQHLWGQLAVEENCRWTLKRYTINSESDKLHFSMVTLRTFCAFPHKLASAVL